MKASKRPVFKFFPPLQLKALDMQDGAYCFSTKNWVRIWFTTKPEQFLSPKNKERVIDFLTRFPTRKIDFIYDGSLLNSVGNEDFLSFQETLGLLNKSSQIEFYDFSSSSFQNRLSNAEEQAIYRFAKLELEFLAFGGSVAAASDIARTLSSIYSLGIYTDFDVQFLDCTLDSFNASSPFLCGIKGSSRCNDVLAIQPAQGEENSILAKYQSNIKNAYRAWQDYDEDERAQFKIGLDLNLMALDEQLDRQQVEEAINRIFLLIEAQDKRYDSLPIILLIRKACIEAVEKNENPALISVYKQIYMHHVIYTSGPSAIPCMSYSDEGECKKLNELVQGQVHLMKNDCSWVPSILTQGVLTVEDEPQHASPKLF